jgi:thiol-disulfide isomerase/thioredoxin
MLRSFLIAIVALYAAVPEVAAQRVEQISLDQAADRVRGSTRPTVVVFYKTTCPISRAMFPTLVSLARDHGNSTRFLVFSVDDPANVGTIPTYLAAADAPFAALHVREWPSGAFIRTMKTFGVEVGTTWTTPLVMVRDGRGQTITSGEGVGNVSALARVLPTLR